MLAQNSFRQELKCRLPKGQAMFLIFVEPWTSELEDKTKETLQGEMKSILILRVMLSLCYPVQLPAINWNVSNMHCMFGVSNYLSSYSVQPFLPSSVEPTILCCWGSFSLCPKLSKIPSCKNWSWLHWSAARICCSLICPTCHWHMNQGCPCHGWWMSTYWSRCVQWSDSVAMLPWVIMFEV